ncbi:unnamed protein product [Rhizoctonia solani]|uniref:Uncharacterized protein n=2 Tax=Rhizoctonia solani TaxID=456999 RepID=A0A8H2XIP6_9AGAM|nr:hypothetical protein RSOL_224160 [Rhizoctonia solani AG-3 Rhs1AP]CAE6424998.1 unnamed protein product [Rhizoctonia solani]CAE6530473.1 unnamed protein product [Rhizoctonia solani]
MAAFLQKSLLGISQILLSEEDDEESDPENEDSMHPEGLLDTQSLLVQSVAPLPSLPIPNHSLSALEHDANSSPENGGHASALVEATTHVMLPSTESTYSQHLSDPGHTVTPHHLQQLILSNDTIASQDTNSVTSQNHTENALEHDPESVQHPDKVAGGSAH